MRDLHLVGTSDDGEFLVLAGVGSERFQVPLDARLLAAVRGEPTRAVGPAEGESALRPAEIQARIRAGASEEDVAMIAGLPLARVRRYAGPVLAERGHVASLARVTSIRRHGDRHAVPLGQFAEDRLAARGIAADALRWDSARREDGNWSVTLTFPALRASGEQSRAMWVFDLRGRVLEPEDDEARWLSDPDPAAVAPADRRPRLVPDRSEVSERSRRTADGTELPTGLAALPLPAMPAVPSRRSTPREVVPPLSERAERPADGHSDELLGREAATVEVSNETAQPEPVPFPTGGDGPTSLRPSGLEPAGVQATDHDGRTQVPDARDAGAGARPISAPVEAGESRSTPPTEAPTEVPTEAPTGAPSAASVGSSDRARSTAGRKSSGPGSRRRAAVPSWDDIVFGTRSTP